VSNAAHKCVEPKIKMVLEECPIVSGSQFRIHERELNIHVPDPRAWTNGTAVKAPYRDESAQYCSSQARKVLRTNSRAAAEDRSGKSAVERSCDNQNYEESGHNDRWDEPALGCVARQPVVSARDCRRRGGLTF